jgi:hypothetical protein
VCPPFDGEYTFYIASDDNSVLYLNPAGQGESGKTLIARVDDWTNSRQWTKYSSQRSGTITLQGGQLYYIEALQKEGGGGDNLAVAWTHDRRSTSPVGIAGQYLAPASALPTRTPTITATPTATLPPAATCPGTGSALREVWFGISGDSLSNLFNNSPYPNSPNTFNYPTRFEAPTDFADNYGTRMQAYQCAPYTGTYTFYIASDDYSRLNLSMSTNPGGKSQIAYVNGWTDSREWTRYDSQKSANITLQAGQEYYIEAIQKEGTGGDNLAVGWIFPYLTSGNPVVIDGQYLIPLSPQATATPMETSRDTPRMVLA